MDPEMIAYFDSHFRENARQFAELRQQISGVEQQLTAFREETGQRFEQVDRRFEQVDQRFEQVDRRFEQVDQRFEQVNQRFEQVDQRFEQVNQQFEQVNQRFEQVETTCRHTLVLVEGLRDQLRVVAEGFLTVNERLQVEIKKSEVFFEDLPGLVGPYYRDLDARVKGLDIRVQAVESRAERQNMDVFQAIEKILSRPRPPEQQAG